MHEIEAVTQEVLEKITPKIQERKKVEVLTHKIEQKITTTCLEEGVQAIVRVEGSVAKDTWLSGNPDIDIFMRMPTSIPRKNLGEVGLRIARKAAGHVKQVERFAEHPFLEIFVDGYRVDIVPCFNAKLGEWQSATDRTPYHTDYIKQHLSEELLGEVRLLKKFMQGIGVYGAEIKVGGFSGYLSELLVMRYGAFSKVVEAFARYNRRVVIDIEGFYANRENECSLLFPEPLVVVDPVDKGRNVASAVQPSRLYTFIAASRAFLKNPKAAFFYPPTPEILSAKTLKRQLASRGSAIIFLVIGQVDVVADVLWGQLLRSKRSLRTLLELNDFRVIKDDAWSDEKTISVLAFELEQQALPNIEKHSGPPLEREAECEKFLAKYVNNKLVISGPYVEDGRWMITLPKKTTDAVLLFQEKLKDGGKKVGVSGLIARALLKDLKVLDKDEVLELYTGNNEFAEFFTRFLSRKPFWLKAR
jgi:tRNA nucleotidyltransferase (CCA-adding enzyme)